MAFYYGSQKDCLALLAFGDFFLFYRRFFRHVDSFGVTHAPRGFGPGGDLQQIVYHARRHDGLFLFNSVDTGGFGEFSCADDDRRPGPCLSPPQSRELVHLYSWGAVYGGRRRGRRCRYGVDFLYSVQQHLFQHSRRADGRGHLYHRLFIHSNRAQFHRHHSHHACSRDDLVSPSPVYLGPLRDQHYLYSGHSGHCDCSDARWAGADLPSRHFRSGAGRRSAAVSTSLLVLFAPGGLHYDSAGDGCRERADCMLLPQAGLRLRLRCLLQPRHCRARLFGLGPSHVRRRTIGSRRHGLFIAQLSRRHSLGDQSF